MAIESMHHEDRLFKPSEEISKNAQISSFDHYKALCKKANENYEEFWADLANELLIWNKPFTKILNEDNAPFYKWFEDGKLNASHNCLDRHLKTQPDKPALIFEADDGSNKVVTFRELYEQVCQLANGLKKLNLGTGERVIIYLPMTIEAVVAMQACARIGLTHSVVFGGFSAKSIQERVIDAQAKAIITADYQNRGGKELPLKQAVDEAIQLGNCESIEKVIVLNRTNKKYELKPHEIDWHELIKDQPKVCDPVWVSSEHPLFLLYTSGSTGKPKGVQHSSSGYLLHAMNTTKWTFDLKDDDIFWCTADVGWITGHSYVAYGPLALGATQIVFEGIPTFPNAGRFWDIVEKHKATIFYTAPTAIRALIKASEIDHSVHPKNYDLSTLRILGTVGEPINPEAWIWYHENVGNSTCPIADTFWQ